MSEPTGYVDRAKKNTIVFKPKKEKVQTPETKLIEVVKYVEVEKPKSKLKSLKPIKAERAVEQVAPTPAPAPTPVVAPVVVAPIPKGRIIFEKGSEEAKQWGKEMALRRKLAKEAKAKQTVVEVKQ
jgi:hypothetical protein